MDVSSILLERNFSQTLFQLGIKETSRIVIGVSGGPDSLALAGLYANWAKDAQSNCRAIIIDHGLRANSAEEAFKAQIELGKLCLDSKIIKIDKTPPRGNVQNWARVQRYKLLTLEARMFRAALLLGHHLNDQIETLYMRLGHNSGLIGLAGMKKERLFHSVKIIRPLLGQEKVDLMAYCRYKDIRPIKDPTNDSMKFERVRARTHLLKDKKLSRQLIKLSQQSEIIVNSFKEFCSIWCSEHILIKPPIYASIPALKFIGLPEIMKVHILQQLLWQIGAHNYPASKNSIKIGLSKISARKKFTLAGCIIIVRKENIEVHAEQKRKNDKPLRFAPNVPVVLDNRWLFETNKPVVCWQQSHNSDQILNQNTQFKHLLKKWPHPARLCIPLLVGLDDRLIQPHIIIGETDINSCQKDDDVMIEKDVTLTPLRKFPFWTES